MGDILRASFMSSKAYEARDGYEDNEGEPKNFPVAFENVSVLWKALVVPDGDMDDAEGSAWRKKFWLKRDFVFDRHEPLIEGASAELLRLHYGTTAHVETTISFPVKDKPESFFRYQDYLALIEEMADQGFEIKAPVVFEGVTEINFDTIEAQVWQRAYQVLIEAVARSNPSSGGKVEQIKRLITGKTAEECYLDPQLLQLLEETYGLREALVQDLLFSVRRSGDQPFITLNVPFSGLFDQVPEPNSGEDASIRFTFSDGLDLESPVRLEQRLEEASDLIGCVLSEVYALKEQTSAIKSIVFSTPEESQILYQPAPQEIFLPEGLLVRPEVTLDDVGGQPGAVRQARILVEAVNKPEAFSKRGIPIPKGVLFVGPPGTGKTMLAKAIAAEANADFIVVNAEEILIKWYGETSRNMAAVFDNAEKSVAKGKRAIIFIDELDALGAERDGSHEVTRQLVTVILTRLDGMKQRSGIIFMGATNHPELVDKALMRPGRIDSIIQFTHPNVSGLVDIFNIHAALIKQGADEPGAVFAHNLDFQVVAEAALKAQFVGADVENLLQMVIRRKIYDELIEKIPWTPVSTQELVDEIKPKIIQEPTKRPMGFRQNVN